MFAEFRQIPDVARMLDEMDPRRPIQ